MIRTLLLACALAAGAYLYLDSWVERPIQIKQEVIIEFKSGTTLKALSAELEQKGVIDHGWLFRIWVKLTDEYPHFQAGRYHFTDKVAPHDIAVAMIKGDTWNPLVLSITIPEGFTLQETIARLARHGVGTVQSLTQLSKGAKFLTSLRIPSVSLEGFIYPATYAFYEMPTPEQAISQMVENFWKNLPPDYESAVKAKGLTLKEAVTFASLIELETRVDEERAFVSEVIWRRLKDKAPLGIDAAIIYGIKDYDGNLRKVHLLDASNSYNTRIHVGLPPTPIGSPSRKSLEAVLTPSNLGYYYYVLKPGDIHHHFSKSLAEHNQHVKILVNSFKKNVSTQGANSGEHKKN